MSNGIFNFNFLALVSSEILRGPKFTLGGHTPLGRPLVVTEILGGPKFTLGGPVPPSTPLAEFFLYQRRVSTLLYQMAFLISTF